MSTFTTHRTIWLVLLLLGLVLVVTWQIALAQVPTPNPLPNVNGVDITATGPAATMEGDPLKGRKIFADICADCHGDRGTEGEDNPGADAGSVPNLDPIDPGLLKHAQGDPAVFARDLDLFVQHGSRPSGPNPELMPAYDKVLTQEQIADVEAYTMQLNGVWWPDKWYPPAEVQMTATRAGTVITYTITLVNHGGSDLTNVQLRDTLPPGLAFIESDYYGLGNNPAQVEGSTVQWLTGGIPRGGMQGPFTIVAGLTGTDVPANVAQMIFDFCTWNNHCNPASQVSDQVVPGTAATATKAAPATTMAAATAVPMPTTAAGGPTPSTQAVAAPNCGKPNCNQPGTAIAQNLKGDPAAGAQVFAANCQMCHGNQGKGGVANPGSTDGTVPALNPTDTMFNPKDRTTFALSLDLFTEHGSTADGPSPTIAMPAYGDNKLLTPQQIADVIAYILSLNP
jgi:uncharacterized repeat protein (TIGR01451 family)